MRGMRFHKSHGLVFAMLLVGLSVFGQSGQLTLDDSDIEEMQGGATQKRSEPAPKKSARKSPERPVAPVKMPEVRSTLPEGSGSILLDQQESLKILHRAIDANRMRVEALEQLAEARRKKYTDVESKATDRLDRLYVANVGESFVLPGDEETAIRAIAMRASAKQAGVHLLKRENDLLETNEELSEVRDVLARQEAMPLTAPADVESLQLALAEAENGFIKIENWKQSMNRVEVELGRESLTELLAQLRVKRQAKFAVTSVPPPVESEPVLAQNQSGMPAIVVQTEGLKPIYAVVAGKVEFAGELRGFDRIVILEHAREYFTVYAHLSRIVVKEGELLREGDLVGISGGLTSSKTGYGVRFEVRKNEVAIEPSSWEELPSDLAKRLLYK